MTTEDQSVDQHQAKLTYLLRIAAMVITVAAIPWVTFFAISKSWLGVTIQLTYIFLGYTTYRLNLKNNTKTVAYVCLPLFFIALCLQCLFFDVPIAAAPRSTHNFLLPLALYTYVLYQNEKLFLRIAGPALALSAFLVFSCTNFGFYIPIMGNEARIFAAWFNNIVTIVMLYLVIFIMQVDFNIRNALENDLSKALLKNELELYFQPQVNEQGKMTGAEVLVRWNHPSLGVVMPDIFIPLAEKSNLILYLGKQVLMGACKQLITWKKSNVTSQLTLSVNISAKQLQDPEFLQHVITSVSQLGIDASKLKLEMTESVFASDLEDIVAKMTQLKSYGIQISLDDFGTGYSSLSYIKHLPLDELKIDKSFIKNVLTNANDAAIAKMIISLAHELHITVIAEGVETIQQRQFLIKNKCHNFQGYFYSRPLPITELNVFVDNATK